MPGLMLGGIALLLLSILIFQWACHIARVNQKIDEEESKLPKPVVAPLLLGDGQTTHLSFVAESDSEYTISLTFEKTIDFDELNIAIQKIENDNDFDVYIEEEGKVILTDGYSGMGYGQNAIALTLTSFNVYEGRHYDVTITSRKEHPELLITAPKAEAAIAFWTLKHMAIDHRGFLRFAAFLFIIGIGLILLAWWRISR